jgi:transcriptional regulator with XRE-family HTH domain
MADILTVVGENIKYYRTKLGMTQEELADRAGINRSYLASLERGRRNTTLKTVEMLAKALGVSTTELVSPSSGVLPENN